jgi:hypothetical protein
LNLKRQRLQITFDQYTYSSDLEMADAQTYDIPKTGKAGVVSNEGPDFKLEVEDVPVPEPGKSYHPKISAIPI